MMSRRVRTGLLLRISAFRFSERSCAPQRKGREELNRAFVRRINARKRSLPDSRPNIGNKKHLSAVNQPLEAGAPSPMRHPHGRQARSARPNRTKRALGANPDAPRALSRNRGPLYRQPSAFGNVRSIQASSRSGHTCAHGAMLSGVCAVSPVASATPCIPSENTCSS